MTDIEASAGSRCQLSYSIQTDPPLVQVSVPGAQSSVALLTVTIVNNSQAVVVISAITVSLPLGDDASGLVVDVSGVTPTVAPSNQWAVNPPSLSEDPTAPFTILPQASASAPLAPGAAIILSLAGAAISHATGTASIVIEESSLSGQGSTALAVTKYPAGFFFDGLLVNVPNGSELQPVAQVPYKTSVTLSWNVSALNPTAIAIFYSSNQGQQGPYHPSAINQWTTPAPIVADTIFTVIVQTSAATGQPVTTALSTSVSVQQPDAVLNQVQAQTLAVAQATTLSGPLSAQKGVAVTKGLVTDSLQASGPATLGAVDVNGVLTVNGSMRALHAPWMWQTPTTGSWTRSFQLTMKNDGFWLVSAPGAASIQFTCNGTTLATASDWFLQPVATGADFSAVIAGSNETTVSVLFIPLGAGDPDIAAEIGVTTSSKETGP